MTDAPSFPGSNLPFVTTQFFGREHEIDRLSEMLLDDNTRLVTLLGPGGIGKTRLAVHVARLLQKMHRLDIVFVDLSAANDSERMLADIVGALHLEDSDSEPDVQILHALEARSPLLILDNLEQIHAASSIVANLLGSIPGLVVLTTSRVPLRIQGEKLFPLPPLVTPDAPVDANSERLADQPAIALFADRAGAVRPGFTITPGNATTVREICLRVDGLPLAIELAAPRMQIFSPEQLLAELNKNIEMLAHGAVDLPQRHQTMQQAIAWSVDLLDADEKHMLFASCIFDGTFSYDGIEAVAGVHATSTANLLSSLVEKSLLRTDLDAQQNVRFRLLQTVRDFGRTTIQHDKIYLDFAQRHADFYVRFASTLADGLESEEQSIWMERGENEYANLIGALHWLIDREDAKNAQAMSGDLWPYWLNAGRLVEGRQLLEQSLDLHGNNDFATRATAENGLGILRAVLGDSPGALESLHRAADLRRKLGDRAGVASVLNNLGNIASRQGLYHEALSSFEEALDILTDLGKSYARASVMINIATAAHLTGDLGRAVDLTRQALGIRRSIHDDHGVAQALHNLALYLDDMHDYIAAESCFMEAITVIERLDNLPMLASTRNTLAASLRMRGNLGDSDEQYLSALALGREIHQAEQITTALEGLGNNAFVRAEFMTATQWVRECLEAHRSLNEPVQAITAIELAAAIASKAGNPVLATTLVSYSQHLRLECQYSINPPEITLDDLRTSLAPDAFKAATEQGRNASFQLIIDWVQGFDPGQAQPMAEDLGALSMPIDASPEHNLTAREVEVLRLIAEGKTNAEIGDDLFISPFTVKTHVAKILGKLDVESRAAAATWAAKSGLL